MNRNNAKTRQSVVHCFLQLMLIMAIVGVCSFDANAQGRIRIDESRNQIRLFMKGSRPGAAQTLNAAIRPVHSALKNGDLVKRAGQAARQNRRMIRNARRVAESSKNIRRAAMASTGVGAVLVAGSIIAEGVIGDSPDAMLIDSATDLAEGRSLRTVASNLTKRLDPNVVARNTARNLKRFGRDISTAVNAVGAELLKIRF